MVQNLDYKKVVHFLPFLSFLVPIFPVIFIILWCFLPSLSSFLPPFIFLFFFFLAPKSYTVHTCFYLFTMTYTGNCSYQFIEIFLFLLCGGRELEIWISLHFHQKWVGYWKHRWVLAFRDLLSWQYDRQQDITP